MGYLDSESRGVDGITLTVSIAAGVAIGTVVAAMVLWLVASQYFSWTAREAAAQLQRSVAEGEARDRAAQQRAVDLEAQRVRSVADVQRADAAAKMAALAEADRREQAWKRFYRPSPGCAGAATSVDCSNEFIRSKRAFEQKYAHGEL